MQRYQSDIDYFEEEDTQILAVSVDSVPAQKKFAEELGVTFPLLSDFQREVSRLYGVLNEERGFAQRTTFVIDKEGIIRRIDAGRDALDITGVKQTCGQLN